MVEQPIGEFAHDLVPPWELRIGSLFGRWLSTLSACVTDPKGFGASLRGGTTRWALLFLLLSALWAAPFSPLAFTLMGKYLIGFLGYYVLFALLQVPLQGFLLAAFMSFVLWSAVRIFRGRMAYLLALRGSAYTLGVAAAAAPVQLLLGVHVWLGVGAITLVWLLIAVLQWRLFNVMARSSGLPVLFSAIAAALPQLVVSLTVGGAMVLISTRAQSDADPGDRTTMRRARPNASANRLPHAARAPKQHTNTEGTKTR